ncbi:MAG: hypothetical protein CNE95_06995 [Puniceicoccaceae bacterium MED-G30]|nr:MAG: hypothetical protein CNE95_06995 [Puniceicoccaceae bacterium MED-G30]
MLTCKQVSKVLQNEDYENLSPLRRFLLMFHIKLCAVCGKFNRQVIDSQDMCCNFKRQEESLLEKEPPMDADRKDALKKLLSEQSGDSTLHRS